MELSLRYIPVTVWISTSVRTSVNLSRRTYTRGVRRPQQVPCYKNNPTNRAGRAQGTPQKHHGAPGWRTTDLQHLRLTGCCDVKNRLKHRVDTVTRAYHRGIINDSTALTISYQEQSL